MDFRLANLIQPYRFVVKINQAGVTGVTFSHNNIFREGQRQQVRTFNDWWVVFQSPAETDEQDPGNIL